MRKSSVWEGLPGGGRRYRYEVKGHHGWKASYVKEVDAQETTLRFYQEISNDRNELMEIHEKYPIDTGHKAVERGEGT
jgi:hypothetical protein